MACREYLREHGFCTTLNQNWDGVIPLAVLQIRINCDGWNVGKPSVDLVATDDIPIAPVRDIGTVDIVIAPSNLGLGVVEEPTLARTSSWGLWRVQIPAWESSSCVERARGRLNLGKGLGWGWD